MMHFSDSAEFDISKNEEVDLTPQGNPRARHVKNFVGGRSKCNNITFPLLILFIFIFKLLKAVYSVYLLSKMK